ncbi:spermidine hydroxycinnamoyl transferase [Arachis duranensis]|uniref:Spermidine hydroxycinnamoyl transferase n=1 Tax=Arachis duranensis TaxID=130453 RepID=A0A6P4DY58_ARADU|nr:spermidine hydroxycinnamoyl transferase [Arachis duranensis]
MVVTIDRSYTITPSDSSSTTIIPLSHCDQTKLPNHGSQLSLYTTSNSSSSTENFRASLSKALNLYYPLAGRLRWIHGGRLQLLCNSKGVTLLEATCHDNHTTLDMLLENLDNNVLLEQFLPKVDYSVDRIDDMPLMAAQFTRLPGNGVVLGMIICRAVVDGAALGNFMTSWSKLARGEDLDSSLVPFYDRGLLDSLGVSVGPRFEHAEFLTPPLWEEQKEEEPQEIELATVVLKLTKGQVEMLKKKAYHDGVKDGFGNGSNSSNTLSSSRPYTSFEVISGHLWRCICKVKNEGNWGQKTRVCALVNCRNRFKPNLPQSYFGNATFPTVTPTCCFDDIVHKPLGYAIQNVRKAIERMNDEYVRSAIAYIANQKDMNSLRQKLYNLGGGKSRVNPNMYIVSWANFPFYEADFGWGKPVCLVPGSINSDGKVFIMNNGSGDGFIVATCLQQSLVDDLKKLFYEDIEEVYPNSKL